jgi:hypothetical protein
MSTQDKDIRYCSNCDDREKSHAKFYCIDCLNSSSAKTSEAYFCTGCSIIHPRIKLYRNHQLFPIYDGHGQEKFFRNLLSNAKQWFSSETTNYALSSLVDGYLAVHDKIDDFLGFNSNMVSMGMVITAVTLYFYVINLIFGRITTLAHIVVLVIFNRYANNNRKPQKDRFVGARHPRSIINALSVGMNKKYTSTQPQARTDTRDTFEEDERKKERRTGYLRLRTRVYNR